MFSHQHVIIIGAGVAGVSFSLFLHRAGISSTIYESYPYFKEAGAGFIISPNGVNVLHELGLKHELEENSTALNQYKIFTHHNEEVSIMNSFDHIKFGCPSVNITRTHVMKMLLAEAESKGIAVEYGKKLVALEQSQTNVTAYFEDQTQAIGTLLVGADGIHSKTREMIFPQGHHLKYGGFWTIQGLVSTEGLGLQNEMLVFMDKTFSLVVGRCHATENKALWQGIGLQERKIPAKHFENKTTNALKADLLNLVDDWQGPVADIFHNSTNLYPRHLLQFDPLATWSKGRVTLIGDAAHGTSPNTGQGTSIALEDAMYLAKMLHEHDYRDAYYYYEFDRKPRINHISKMFEQADPFMLGITDDIFNYQIQWDEEKEFSLK
ncbi:FAD-dependent oxidoreductase [Paenibacillus sp. 481]|uniref:FAD-dependent oxidoreductase n=1 Tax=Paenibacillus sp. 481 TaxID=2835869 RepID=UPI001E4C3970|nr:FAD-dependent monooxygenase [Paenibacillus sp. 481]UHA73211.1 FAD-dependent monooxygenase [Paenibacillus sp. 481]